MSPPAPPQQKNISYYSSFVFFFQCYLFFLLFFLIFWYLHVSFLYLPHVKKIVVSRWHHFSSCTYAIVTTTTKTKKKKKQEVCKSLLLVLTRSRGSLLFVSTFSTLSPKLQSLEWTLANESLVLCRTRERSRTSYKKKSPDFFMHERLLHVK